MFVWRTIVRGNDHSNTDPWNRKGDLGLYGREEFSVVANEKSDLL